MPTVGAALAALVLEDSMDLGVLILVLDLRAALLHVLAGVLELFHLVLEAPGLERQVPGRLGAVVEVLVPPLDGRHEHAHTAPVHSFPLGAFLPQEGVAGPGQHDDVGAGAVAVGLLVLAHGELRKVRAHGVVDELEQGGAVAAAALLVVLGLELPQVRDEVGLPHPALLHAFEITPGLPPLVGVALVAVTEGERVVEDVVEVPVAVDDDVGVGQRDHPHRLPPLGVEVLEPGVERDGEQASPLPFQRVLPAALVPKGGGALAGQDEHRLLEQVALRPEFPARRDLLYHRVAGAAGAVEVDERSLAAGARPVAQLQLQEIIDDESLVYGDAFPLLVDFVRAGGGEGRRFVEVSLQPVSRIRGGRLAHGKDSFSFLVQW